MPPKDVELLVRDIVTKIAHGDYDYVVASCAASRVAPDDLRRVLDDYGKTFVVPPTDAYKRLDAVEVLGASKPTWSVCAPLWSVEEGRSDLHVELTVWQEGANWNVELDDLHVP